MTPPEATSDEPIGIEMTAARSNVEDVYGKLRQAILDGELSAGSRLSQVQLAAQYDMSRGPLREALRLLERDGLVVTEHQRMVRVAPVSFGDLDELYSLRIINESFAVGRSAPLLSSEQVDCARGSLATMDQATETGDWVVWRASHRAFHAVLYEPCGERTSHLLAELFDHADRYRRIYHKGEQQAATVAAVEHREILRACAEQAGDEAQILVARHLARTVLTLFADAAPEHDARLVREAIKFTTRIEEPSTRTRKRLG